MVVLVKRCLGSGPPRISLPFNGSGSCWMVSNGTVLDFFFHFFSFFCTKNRKDPAGCGGAITPVMSCTSLDLGFG